MSWFSAYITTAATGDRTSCCPVFVRSINHAASTKSPGRRHTNIIEHKHVVGKITGDIKKSIRDELSLTAKIIFPKARTAAPEKWQCQKSGRSVETRP